MLQTLKVVHYYILTLGDTKMISRSLDFDTFRKAYERTNFLYMYKTFTVPWIFLSGTPYERKLFYISKAVDVYEWGFFLYKFLEGQQNTYEWKLIVRAFRAG